MPEVTTIKGIENGRADYAYSSAEAGSKIDKSKEYKAYARKIPMLIKSNGLGATLAFVYAKGAKGGKLEPKHPYGLLYLQIANWFIEHKKFLLPGLNDKNELAKEIIKLDSWNYRAVTVEVLALLGWLRRFAEGLIEGEADSED